MKPLILSKDNQQRIKDLIQFFKGKDAMVIGVPTELIHFIGDAGKAVLLAQLIYWSSRGSRSDGLIFKTYKEIFNETGIKERTCNRYYKEFKDMGFFDWCRKKAYGNPTVHYKLDMDKLCELMQTFWENQNGQNDRNETVKTSESLTENTNKDNTLSNRATRAASDKEQKTGNERQEVIKNILDFHCNTASTKTIAGFNLGEKVLLPLNFTPTWDKQFRAVMEFPNKSPAYVTEKFLRKYSIEKSHTLFQWNLEWWDWIVREFPHQLSDTTKLDKEQYEILYKVWNHVYKLSYQVNNKVFHRDEFCKGLQRIYCEQTIDDCLKVLVEDKDFGQVDNYYFNLKEYKESLEWKTAVDNELQTLSLVYNMTENEAEAVS